MSRNTSYRLELTPLRLSNLDFQLPGSDQLNEAARVLATAGQMAFRDKTRAEPIQEEDEEMNRASYSSLASASVLSSVHGTGP